MSFVDESWIAGATAPEKSGLKASGSFVDESWISGEPIPTEEPSILGFLKSPESWKAMGKTAAGTLAATLDFFTGFVAGGLDIPGQTGTIIGQTLAGASSKEALEAAKNYHLLPDKIRAPWAAAAASLGGEAQKAYEENPVSWINQYVGKAVEAVGDTAGKGSAKSEGIQLALQQTMGLLGFKAAKGALGKAASARFQGVVKEQLPPIMEAAPEVTPTTEVPTTTPTGIPIADSPKAAMAAEKAAAKATKIKEAQVLPQGPALYTHADGAVHEAVITGDPVLQGKKSYTPVTVDGADTWVPTKSLKEVPKPVSAVEQAGLETSAQRKARMMIAQTEGAPPENFVAEILAIPVEEKIAAYEKRVGEEDTAWAQRAQERAQEAAPPETLKQEPAVEYPGERYEDVPEPGYRAKAGTVDARYQKQKGAADPKMLALIATAGGTAAYLAAHPEDAERVALLGGAVGAIRFTKDTPMSELLKHIREDTPQAASAFAKIYQDTMPYVRRFTNSFAKDINIDDLIQETYTKLWKSLQKDPNEPGGFRGDASVQTHVINIAKNTALDMKDKLKGKEETSLDVESEDGQSLVDTLGHEETPQKALALQQLGEHLQAAFEKIDPRFAEVVKMQELDGMSVEEISAKLTAKAGYEVPVGTVKSRLFRGREQLQQELKSFRDLQAGKVDPALLISGAAITTGAVIGSIADPQKPLEGALYGALAGGALGTAVGRKALGAAIKSPDVALGLISTRLGNIAPSLKITLRNHELRTFKELQRVNDAVLPFITMLSKLPAASKAVVERALLNGDFDTLRAHPELRKVLPQVQAVLGDVETKLKDLGRFGEGVVNYFPRLVKDFEGLKAALGQEAKAGLVKALVDAEAKMLRKQNRTLTEVEQSIIANRYLFAEESTSFQAGFTKARRVKEVTPELQQYYEAPTESLLRYVSGAVSDLETARFFGKDRVDLKKGKKSYTDVDSSIGGLTARMVAKGEMTSEQAKLVQNMLKARFEGGEQGMSQGLATVRNLSNAALLGNVMAAATQVGDSLAVIYHHGLIPTLQAVVEKVIGKERVSPKQLGLVNHVAEELSDKALHGRYLHTTLKYSGFQAIDMFAKGLGLNAAIIKNARLVSSPAGLAKFTAKYGTAFEPAEFAQLVKDLKGSKATERVEQLAFSELSDMQPVSKAEMPELYLKHPNGRILYQLKTYMLKQADVVRRDAYQEIASGESRRVMLGLKNLTALATVYAVANVPGDAIKDWLAGRPIEAFNTPKMVENVMQTFGLNRYSADNIRHGKVVETGVSMLTPPVKVLQDLAQLKPEAVKYAPILGRSVYDKYLGGNERREIADNRFKMKGKTPAERIPLSPKAKEYLRNKQLERKAEALRKQLNP